METDFSKFRQDPKNYKKGLIYYCPEDPCLVLPKRDPWMGWTINFAHPWALYCMLLFVLAALAPSILSLLLIFVFKVQALWALFLMLVAALAAAGIVIGLAFYLSNRPLGPGSRNVSK